MEVRLRNQSGNLTSFIALAQGTAVNKKFSESYFFSKAYGSSAAQAQIDNRNFNRVTDFIALTTAKYSYIYE